MQKHHNCRNLIRKIIKQLRPPWSNAVKSAVERPRPARHSVRFGDAPTAVCGPHKVGCVVRARHIRSVARANAICRQPASMEDLCAVRAPTVARDRRLHATRSTTSSTRSTCLLRHSPRPLVTTSPTTPTASRMWYKSTSTSTGN